MQELVEDALDCITGSRSSNDDIARGLHALEGALVDVCRLGNAELETFQCMQHMFQYNIPSRLLPWISQAIYKLERLTHGESTEESKANQLSNQIATALSIIQGIVLVHPASKAYASRKYSLEILVDLLKTTRLLSSGPLSSASNKPDSSTLIHAPKILSATILDTLLCILVDSPSAMRTFEDIGGIQTVVKLLKRAGTPRESRMKSLEFLYFYLLDEAPSADGSVAYVVAPPSPVKSSFPHNAQQSATQTAKTKKALAYSARLPSKTSSMPDMPTTDAFRSPSKATPLNSKACRTVPAPTRFPSNNNFPRGPPGRLHSITSDFSSIASGTSASDIKTAPNTPTRNHGQSRSSLALSNSTRKNSQSSHDQFTAADVQPPRTPSPTDKCHSHRPPMLMLKKDVNFVPSSPQKADKERRAMTAGERRTTEEKTALLSEILGNVEALVEGVRKAGIWGLPG